MPYIKPKKVPFDNFAKYIKGRCSSPELAAVIGCSAPTARKKINNPELFTLGDLKKISERKHIPIEELRGEIKI